MIDLFDQFLLIILSPVILLGQIANSYSRVPPTTYNPHTDFNKYFRSKFGYYAWELPEDYDCDDLPNKYKWIGSYRTEKYSNVLAWPAGK